jgi:hypothetical protein
VPFHRFYPSIIVTTTFFEGNDPDRQKAFKARAAVRSGDALGNGSRRSTAALGLYEPLAAIHGVYDQL